MMERPGLPTTSPMMRMFIYALDGHRLVARLLRKGFGGRAGARSGLALGAHFEGRDEGEAQDLLHVLHEMDLETALQADGHLVEVLLVELRADDDGDARLLGGQH